MASIVIRARDEVASLGQVLTEVFAQEEAGPTEVLVIDSGSTDGTLDVARRFPVRLHQIDPASFSFGSALNLGARLARAPVCVHLSAHCVPTERRWLTRLLVPLAAPRVVATFGRQQPVPGLNPYEEVDLERIFPPRPLPAGARRFFSNANCAIRRDALLTRPFDEAIPIMEDALWLLELPDDDEVVYVPDASVWHSHPVRLGYWYGRYRRDGIAYQYIQARRGTDLLPERAFRIGPRLLALAAEARLFTRELAARQYWRHLALYPLFSLVRELAVRRGLREGARRYRVSAHPITKSVGHPGGAAR